jgi:branched-chain amino acid transport system substrate-binding protein
VAATGTPINIGTIDTKEPGTDFSDGPNMINAYFTCLNANGGVNGHPLKLFVIYDQTQPSQISSAAHKLIQTDHVIGIVGVFDLLECTLDQSYWQQLGIYEMGAGIAPECWSTPHSAAVNMGPRYSSDGAVQYALAQHVGKIVFVQSNVPGTGYIAAGPAALAAASHVPIKELTENVPIQDASSVALNLVDDAGPNGWVVLNFTPPEALVILQAAQKLGLEDRVKGWGCSTPCNTDFLAKSLGPKWNHKLFVNAELTDPDDHNGPEMQLYKAILAKYGQAVAGGIGSFSQMGFVLAKFATQALDTVKGPYTMASVNAAFKNIKGATTEMLCQPWTYGSYPLHIPNNADFTTTPDNGKMVTAQGCTPISSADPQIAAYRKVAGLAPSTEPPTGS